MGLFCPLGLLGGFILGFVGVLVFGPSCPKAGAGRGGGAFPLAIANTFQVFSGTLGGGEKEATGHLVELGVVWVFHLDHPRFPPVDTGDGAHLHTRALRDVDFGADGGVVGTIPPPLGGEVVLWPLWPGSAWGGWGAFPFGGGGGWLHQMSHWTQNAIWSFSCHHFWWLRVWGVVVWPWGAGGARILFHGFVSLPIAPHHPCPYPLILRPRVPHLT